MKVAFVGLGVMGYPMAGHLAAGHDVSVFNRSPGKAQRWVAQHGGRTGASVADAVAGCTRCTICESGKFETCHGAYIVRPWSSRCIACDARNAE